MYEQTTKKAPLNTILEEMYNTGRRLAYFDKETSYSIWDREIKKTKKREVKTISFEDTIFYDKSQARKVCSFIDDDKFKETYIEFRRTRKDKHKDTMTQRAELMLFKKLGQKHRLVAIDMLEEAIKHEWKSIYEDKTREADILAKVRIEEDKQRQLEEEEKRRKESEAIREHKQEIWELIKQTWKTKEYWEEQARIKILSERKIDERFIWPLIPVMLNKLVKEYINNK